MIEIQQFTEESSTVRERKRGTMKHPENKMALVHPYLEIMTLSVNGLNSQIKRHAVARSKQTRKRDPTLYLMPARGFS